MNSRTTSVARFSVLGFSLLWLVLSAPAVLAYPAPKDDYVNDFADLLDAGAEERLRRHLAEAKAEHQLTAVVVTVNTFDDYGVGVESIEEFATGLFNTWGIGEAGVDRGALLLVAKGDRKVRIELGSGYGRSRDSAMKRVIDRTIVPRFKEGRFQTGVVDGARAMTRALLSSAAAPQQRMSAPAQPAGSTDRPKSGGAPWGLGAAAAALLTTAGLGWRFHRRRRPRPCPSCSRVMRRLTEAEEDQYLGSAEQTEERVGSVDYDVWLCESCGATAVERYGKALSGYKQCGSCAAKAVLETSRITTQATEFQSGERTISQRCVHCDWRDERMEMIPMLVSNDPNSTSGGASSFGGGSSSGGGASGSW
ncbi:MAG: TPM domain-containing protein [Acidobacteriota bacterium]